MSTRSTSLLAYVIDYLTEEHQRIIQSELPESTELVTAAAIQELVQQAVDAYGEGAR